MRGTGLKMMGFVGVLAFILAASVVLGQVAGPVKIPVDNEGNAVSLSRIGVYPFVYDGSTWDRWTGAVTQSGTWTVTANAGTNLNTSALALDATVTGRLPAGGSPADNESNTNTSLSRIGSFLFIFDGSTWDRWTGAVTGTVTANAGTNLNTSALLTDSTYTGRTPAGASPADNESNTNTALSRVGAFNFIFDGSTWDRDTGARSVTSFPDNEPFNQAQVGGAAVAAGPCEREVPLYVQVDQTSGEQLITGTASERIYICSVALVTAAAQNSALVDGTGSVCATSPTGLAGGSTAATGQNYAANSGWVLPFNPGAWAKTSTDADNVCLLQSGSGQISGVVTYVSVPNI